MRVATPGGSGGKRWRGIEGRGGGDSWGMRERGGEKDRRGGGKSYRRREKEERGRGGGKRRRGVEERGRGEEERRREEEKGGVVTMDAASEWKEKQWKEES